MFPKLKVFGIQYLFLIYETRSFLLHGRKDNNFDNLKITEINLESRTVRSPTECLVHCSGIKTCLSFSFNNITSVCVLFGTDYVTVGSTAVVPENNWAYFFIKRDCLLSHTCLSRIGYSYHLPLCFCYKYDPTKRERSIAQNICKQDGGNLWKIDSKRKQITLQNILDDVADGIFFIQGTLMNSFWRYDDGTKMMFFNWNTAAGQPQGNVNEIHLVMKREFAYLWHDVFATEYYASVCEIT